jgi:hypothetical protein
MAKADDDSKGANRALREAFVSIPTTVPRIGLKTMVGISVTPTIL